MTECAFALALGWRLLDVGMTRDGLSNMLGLCAVTYVGARGVDNWNKAREEQGRNLAESS